MLESLSMAEQWKRTVSEFQLRQFGSSTKTLPETILSLIPREATCECGGERCLACCGDDPMSFLIQPGDPPEYQELLNKCCVVVSDAPCPPVYFERFWPQTEIVKRIIDLMLRERPTTSNLICWNYNKGSRSSFAVDELTSSKWVLLLNRVCFDIMIYLLRHTSILIPLPGKDYLQLTGHPLYDLRSAFSAHMPHMPRPRKQPRLEACEPLSDSCSSNMPKGNANKSARRHLD